jgi:NADH dehydrogenase (ubiquinone) 1 alpha/beta subcomplex 1, acyl-carrier protein
MFRFARYANLRAVSRVSVAQVAPRSAMKPAFIAPQFGRMYSTTNLSKEEVENRIVTVFKAFDKIEDPTKITPTAKFSTDLGLDSLDTVEVIVAVEEEFGIEIPEYVNGRILGQRGANLFHWLICELY